MPSCVACTSACTDGSLSKTRYIGAVATAIEGALVYARHAGPERSRLEAAARDKDAAVRKAHRAKDLAVSEAMKSAREKLKAMDAGSIEIGIQRDVASAPRHMPGPQSMAAGGSCTWAATA
mgnify:CR=1 FL=1